MLFVPACAVVSRKGAAYGVRAVIDLRHHWEVARAPYPFTPPVISFLEPDARRVPGPSEGDGELPAKGCAEAPGCGRPRFPPAAERHRSPVVEVEPVEPGDDVPAVAAAACRQALPVLRPLRLVPGPHVHGEGVPGLDRLRRERGRSRSAGSTPSSVGCARTSCSNSPAVMPSRRRKRTSLVPSWRCRRWRCRPRGRASCRSRGAGTRSRPGSRTGCGAPARSGPSVAAHLRFLYGAPVGRWRTGTTRHNRHSGRQWRGAGDVPPPGRRWRAGGARAGCGRLPGVRWGQRGRRWPAASWTVGLRRSARCCAATAWPRG